MKPPIKPLHSQNGDASIAELLRQAIQWEATRSAWHHRHGNIAEMVDAENRANFYAKQYNALPENAHRYVFR